MSSTNIFYRGALGVASGCPCGGIITRLHYVFFWKHNFKQHLRCKFDLAKNLFFIFLLLFIYIYIYTSSYIVKQQCLIFNAPTHSFRHRSSLPSTEWNAKFKINVTLRIRTQPGWGSLQRCIFSTWACIFKVRGGNMHSFNYFKYIFPACDRAWVTIRHIGRFEHTWAIEFLFNAISCPRIDIQIIVLLTVYYYWRRT